MPRFTDTIAALATPVGTSAIAALRVSGPDTERLMGEIFGSSRPLPRVARHSDYRDCTGTLLDDVLFTFFRSPHSYSGEDTLEISSHGNPFVVQKILEDLLARGCRAAAPGEFTQRAYLNGRMDLSQAEAVMDLISARSERALAAAHQQLRGSLGRRIAGLTDSLLDTLARVEAYIDFPEEDLPPENRALIISTVEKALADTDRLLATSHYGELLREGIKTVILGAPNAGKSSLLNRFVGRDRALVSAEPGTTRDFIEERILLGPHCFRLIDTAGLNPSPAPLEKLGIEKTLERADEADLFLLVLDASRPAPDLPAEVLKGINTKPTIVVINKIDLVGGKPPAQWPVGPTIAISALTGAGTGDLISAMITIADGLQPSTGGDVVAINARHADALARARRSLSLASTALRNESEAIELFASDIRGALDALGEIAGRADNEAMLDRLFSTFCIGK